MSTQRLHHPIRGIPGVVLLLSGMILTPPLPAQTSRKPPTPGERTMLSLTILTADNASAFRARLWKSSLEKLKIPFRIRARTSADKIGVRETRLGTFRKVTMTGLLDRRGRLVFADRAFSRKDFGKLGEWVRELKTFGAQGAPSGQPLWGLKKTQFGEVFKAMSGKVKKGVHGQKLLDAIAGLGMPRDYPLRFSIETRRILAGRSDTVRKHVKGHSVGTALALILRDAGLGFRPLRTPKGSIELSIDPLAHRADAWPIGWKPKLHRAKTAPKLFLPGPVELNKVKLLDVYHAYAVKTGIPVHVDHHTAKKHKIDVAKLVVSYPRRKVSGSVLLRDLSSLHRLSRELKIDELGQPFVWVTVFVPKSQQR